MNYYQYFKNTVLRLPYKTAVIFQDRHYTYRELDERICRLASVMKQNQIKKGKHVGLICTNCNACIEIILAAAMLGAVSEQFNWRTSPSEMAELIQDSSADLVFLTADLLERFHALNLTDKKELNLIVIGDTSQELLSYERLLAAAPANLHTEELSSDDPLFVFYTSGTTSKPRRVLLSIGSVLYHNMALLADIGWREDDVHLHYLPLFHTSSGGIYCTLFTGGTVSLQVRFNAEDWIRAVKEQNVSSCGMVPNTIAWLTDHPEFSHEKLPSLRWMIYAGAPMPRDVLEKAIRRMGSIFVQLYGMTEMCPSIAILTPADHLRLLNEKKEPLPNGRPLFGSFLAVMNEDGSLCQPYATGEIVVRGPQMMLGYEGQPELTASVIRDGWYHTGDLGYLDEHQYLYLIGRKNRMIISGGENIYPSQVESCIRSMGDMIADVAVLGIPDDKWGEAVAAVIALKPGYSCDEAEVLRYCQEHLPDYMKPRYLRFVEKIPHLESGKVEYKLLKSFFSRSATKS